MKKWLVHACVAGLSLLTFALSALGPAEEALEHLDEYRFEVESVETQLQPVSSPERARSFGMLALKNYGEAKRLLELIQEKYTAAKLEGDTDGMAAIEAAVNDNIFDDWVVLQIKKLQRLKEKIGQQIGWVGE